jgi:long-chain fatty acid transport protein
VALGLGIYTPAGSGLQWDNNWLGKYLVQSISLKCIFFQPTVSYRISDFLSVGAGFVYGTGIFDYSAAMPIHGAGGPGYDDGQVKLHGNATGIGFNAGANIKVNEQLQLGVTYRSQVKMGISGGSANFTVPGSLRDSFPNTRFDSHLPVPQVISAGIGYRTGAWTFQLDLNYTIWTSFDSLKFDFNDHTSSLKDIHAPRHYQNVFTARIGACLKVSKVVSLMAGGAYDPSPVPNGFVSPDLPDANRVIVTGGISIKPLPRFTILAAVEAASGVKRAASYDFGGFSGTYKTEAVAPGLGIYYNF